MDDYTIEELREAAESAVGREYLDLIIEQIRADKKAKREAASDAADRRCSQAGQRPPLIIQ